MTPSRLDLALEAPRAWAELAGFVAATPVLRALPKGEGRPVLVLPGFLADDSSTLALRRLLRRLGHTAYGWRLGRNLGPTDDVIAGLGRSVESLSERHGQPVSLVGWSLGGVFARQLGRIVPERVRQVVSLGSPFNLVGSDRSRVTARYERLGHRRDTVADLVTSFVPTSEPLPVPSSAVYSRTDGIVDWRACIQRPGPRSENIEVRGSHCGLGHNPAVALVVADRLRQPERTWSPFRAPRPARIWFPTPAEPAEEPAWTA